MSNHFSMGAINKITNKYEYPKIATKGKNKLEFKIYNYDINELFDFNYEKKLIHIDSLKENQYVLMAEIIKTKKYYIKLYNYLNKDISDIDDDDDNNIYHQMIIEIDNFLIEINLAKYIFYLHSYYKCGNDNSFLLILNYHFDKISN
jgi:hypothetical protein